MRSVVAVVTVAVLWCGLFSTGSGAETLLRRHAVLGAGVSDTGSAVTVTLVVPSSAAAAAGLRRGDVVTGVDGRDVHRSGEFLEAIREHAPHIDVPIAIVRDGKPRMLHAILAQAADERDPDVDTIYGAVSVAGTLRRTLVTLPKNMPERRPAVLVIGGIGCYSVDVANQPEDAYMRVTHDLSRAGFVTMRLEKSGVGDSAGPPCRTVDFSAESRSYAIALAALRSDPRVDPARVYLLGHSIGSLIAPRLALQSPVAGAIVAEGVGRNWFEYELINLRRQLVLGSQPAPPADVDATMAEKEICMHELLIEHRPEASIERALPACKQHNGIYPVGNAYVQEVAALNVAQPWTKLDVPVLAVYGSADYETALDDHERIVGIVNGAHPGRATLRVIDGMDHRLTVAGSAQLSALNAETGKAEPYDARFSDVVTGWLCARESCAAYKEGKSTL